MIRDGRTHPRCPRCGVAWRQRGDATGHCTSCHETFDSLRAFDMHQKVIDGRAVCTAPAEVKGLASREDDGVTYWRTVLAVAA